MSEAKFTKGEWEASDVRVNGEHIRNSWKVSVGGFLLADVTSGATFGVVDEIQKANAHLIAAAPEMYELLEAISKYNNGCGGSLGADGQFHYKVAESDFIKINNLLAKARGES